MKNILTFLGINTVCIITVFILIAKIPPGWLILLSLVFLIVFCYTSYRFILTPLWLRLHGVAQLSIPIIKISLVKKIFLGLSVFILLVWLVGQCGSNKAELQSKSSTQEDNIERFKTTHDPKFKPYTMIGIPIQGRVMDVVKQFENIGYVIKEHDASKIVHTDSPNTYNIIMNNGELTIGLHYNTDTQTIYTASVFMPKATNWHYLFGAYNSARNELIKLHGQVSLDNDFTSFYRPYKKGDGNEIEAILTNNCKYKSYWSLPNVTLSVTIANTCQVGVVAGLKYNSITLD